MDKAPTTPVIGKIRVSDLQHALASGMADFMRAPQFGLFFGGFYALGGLLLMYGLFGLGLFWLSYPMVIGFALVGPFVATGLYEVSRRLEAGRELDWGKVLGVIWQQHRRELGWMAFVMLFVFWIWMYQIRTLVVIFFGSAGFADLGGFLDAVLHTQNGITFLLVGHLVGAAISLALFSITVISCPLLLNRDLDFVTAMVTSIRTVVRSPAVMLGWGYLRSLRFSCQQEHFSLDCCLFSQSWAMQPGICTARQFRGNKAGSHRTMNCSFAKGGKQ